MISDKITLPFLPFETHGGRGIEAVDISPDGKYFATGGNGDGTVRIWEVKSRTLLHVYKGSSYSSTYSCVKFSPDGKFLAGAEKLSGFIIWEFATRKRDFQYSTDSRQSIAFSPDGKIFATAGGNGPVIFDFKTKKILYEFIQNEIFPYLVALSPDGKLLASLSFKNIKIWHIEKRILINEFKSEANLYLNHIEFSPDGRFIGVGNENGEVFLLEIETNTISKGFYGHTERILSIKFTENGKNLITASSDGTIRIWNIESRSLIEVLDGQSGEITAFALSYDEKLMISVSKNNSICFWDLPKKELIQVINSRLPSITTVTLSPSGKYIASGGTNFAVYLWDVEASNLQHVFKKHEGAIELIAFSPNEHYVASSGFDNLLNVWDIKSKKLCCKFEGNFGSHLGGISCIKFITDDILLCGAGDIDNNSIMLWQLSTKELLHNFEPQKSWINGLYLFPDNTTLASCSDEDIYVLDLQSKEILFKFEDYFEMFNVTKDQKYIVLYPDEEEYKVWSVYKKCYVNFTKNEIKELNFVPLTKGSLYDDFKYSSKSLVTHLGESIFFSFSYMEYKDSDLLKSFVRKYFDNPYWVPINEECYSKVRKEDTLAVESIKKLENLF